LGRDTIAGIGARAVVIQPELQHWIDSHSTDIMDNLKPLIRAWMDEHLPTLIEAAVASPQARLWDLDVLDLEQRHAVIERHNMTGREVPADHFGALVYFCFAPDRATGHATAAPFIPRGRVDDETLVQCTAFGPPEILIERLEEYVRAGGSKFIARPMVPPAMMEEQITRLANEVVPLFHSR